MASRWPIYVFVLVTTMACVTLAVVMDLITCRLCPEYFVRGKGLDPDHLFREAVWLAVSASYWVGFLAAILLVAVNEVGKWPALPCRSLYQCALIILAVDVLCGLISAAMHAVWALPWLGLEVHMLAQPRAFCAVWGLNRGSYAGALLGFTLAAGWILRQRRTI